MKKILLPAVLIISFFNKIQAQNIYRLNNRFDSSKFDTLYKKESGGTILQQVRKIDNSLKGYIVKQSDDRDTLSIKFWYITDTKKIHDKHKGDSIYINSDDNDSTFIYKIKWVCNKFKVPFSAKTFTATTIPFRYRLKKDADLEAEFLNVGVNFFIVHGTTTFFHQEQIESRQSYFGWGPFIAFSQLKIDSSNTMGKIKAEKQVAAISYGASIIKSWDGFSILLAVGFDNTIGSNARYWNDNNFKRGLKPWVGFGFGLKLTDLAFKATNESK